MIRNLRARHPHGAMRQAAADPVSGRAAAAMNGQQEAEIVELKKSPA
jgi:hypothetical protein